MDRNIKEGVYLQNRNYLVTESPIVKIKINTMAIKIPMIIAAVMMK